MTEKRFEEFLKREAHSYNEPPPTPREEIWKRVAAVRHATRPIAKPSTTWKQVVLAIAAVLIVGIGIGRWSVTGVSNDANIVATTIPDSSDDSQVYRVAAMDHLDQLDMFITLFKADAREGRTDSSTGVWAQDLLMTTRLMMDSPAGDDPGMRELLEDLELVLAQITDYVAQRDETELELIQEDLEDNGVLLRLKAELAVNSADLTAQGEI